MSVTSPGLMKTDGNMASTGLLPMPCSTSVSGLMPLDAVDLLHIPGRGVLELLDAVVGVTAVLGLLRLLLERLDHAGKGHLVGLAHAEVDELHARIRGQRGALRALDLLELVDLLFLAEHLAADALGEEGLDVGFVRCRQLLSPPRAKIIIGN